MYIYKAFHSFFVSISDCNKIKKRIYVSRRNANGNFPSYLAYASTIFIVLVFISRWIFLRTSSVNSVSDTVDLNLFSIFYNRICFSTIVTNIFSFLWGRRGRHSACGIRGIRAWLQLAIG